LTFGGYRVGNRLFDEPFNVTSDESAEAAVSEVMWRDGRIDLLANSPVDIGSPPVW
jgi:hypothetical protein